MWIGTWNSNNIARTERESMGELKYSAIGLSGCCKREESMEEIEANVSKLKAQNWTMQVSSQKKVSHL